ncbi:MAG: class I SAM-dependent methyltransferase [Ginsengibacter sp.]
MFSTIKSKLGTAYYHLSKIKKKKYNKILRINELNILFNTRNLKYRYFHNFFWNLAPSWLREHRKYFSQSKRGFGEDAFHSMWYFIFEEFQPKDILEIGIYRGQTLSLFALLSKNFGFETNIHGISPFTSAGDNVSNYLENLDYYNDVITNFDYFGLLLPTLHKGFSTDKEILEVIQSQQWDLIYIDGNHDYKVAKQDFNVCSKYLRRNGLIILDDASLYTDFKPPLYSTAGHQGPSKIASEIDPNLFKEILSAGHNRVFKKL